MVTRRLIPSLLPSLLVALGVLLPIGRLHAQNAKADAIVARETRHESEDWKQIEPHLPDPKTAEPARLELEGDVLRARRFEEDALEYYQYALNRGGDPARLMNRMGITELTMLQPNMARPYFAQVVILKPKDASGWNNLGATEYFVANYRAAMTDYLKAVKLEKKNAVFRANLATVYFQLKDYESARREFARAYQLDPNVFHPEGGNGIQARVLSATERGRFCFELAKVAGRSHDDVAVIAWLTKASEAGFDLGTEMSESRELQPYRNDPRVLLIERNAKAVRAGRTLAAVAVPALPKELSKPD
jgi:tetratricopeptide (TPR) repeat protein